LRQDFDAPQVRGLARKTKDGPQARRLLALAAIYDGATRTEAAKIGGVGLQIIRDWVLRFNARGPDGLPDGKSTGQPSKLNDTQRQAIAGMIESGPIPAVHGVVRWRLIDLAQWIFGEFRITIAKQTLSRELRAMDDFCNNLPLADITGKLLLCMSRSSAYIFSPNRMGTARSGPAVRFQPSSRHPQPRARCLH